MKTSKNRGTYYLPFTKQLGTMDGQASMEPMTQEY